MYKKLWGKKVFGLLILIIFLMPQYQSFAIASKESLAAIGVGIDTRRDRVLTMLSIGPFIPKKGEYFNAKIDQALNLTVTKLIVNYIRVKFFKTSTVNDDSKLPYNYIIQLYENQNAYIYEHLRIARQFNIMVPYKFNDNNYDKEIDKFLEYYRSEMEKFESQFK